MAYPTYINYISASDSSATTTHTITWPSGVTNGNLLYGVFAAKDYGTRWIDTIKSNNVGYEQWKVDGASGTYDTIRIFYFWAIAGSTNTLVLTSEFSVIGRWIVYEFSDHNVEYASFCGFFGLAGEIFTNTSGTHFDCPICPNPAYYGAHDYTWLTFVCYDQSSIYTCPTLFSNQINNIRTDTDQVSISVARYTYNTEQLDPGNWDTGLANNMAYISHTVRIPPGIYPEDVPHGFGFVVPSNNLDLP